MPVLNRLENIISRDIAVIISHPDSYDRTTAAYLIEDFPTALQQEAERIKNNIMRSACDCLHQNQLRKYIRSCQYRLISLEARLIKYTEPDKLVVIESVYASPAELLCLYIHRCLDGLLAFVEQHFGKFIYWNAWMHRNYIAIIRSEVTAALETTTPIFNKNVSCVELQEILKRTFQRFLDDSTPQVITYGRISYLRSLLHRLSGIKADDYQATINSLLLSKNFNSRAYFRYWVAGLTRSLEEKPSAYEKLVLLATEGKRIRQHPFVQRQCYNPRALPLPEMMTRWIIEEAELLERLNAVQVITSDEQETGSALEDKIELGISVATLAAAVRALIKSNTLPDENLTALGRMLSKCFTTIRSGGNFSVGTFRQSYYTITDPTRKTVIEIFQKAVVWLRKNE